jgi:hypothetical protein
MCLTKADLKSRLVPSDYNDPYTIKAAIADKFACGITIETATNIFNDYTFQRTW